MEPTLALSEPTRQVLVAQLTRMGDYEIDAETAAWAFGREGPVSFADLGDLEKLQYTLLDLYHLTRVLERKIAELTVQRASRAQRRHPR